MSVPNSRSPVRRSIFLALIVLAGATVVALAIAWAFAKNGTLLVRVASVELPSPGVARFATITIDGVPHLIVGGHDPGSFSSRGLARMRQMGGDCHVEVDRVLYNPDQASGNYTYIFPTKKQCARVTFGRRRLAVAPIISGARPR